ncbi:MAG: tetratricopeptide repeat protein [Pseudomonadota bacterium]
MNLEIKKLIKIGKEAFDNRHYEKAEKYFKQVIKKKAKFPDIFNLLGLIYHEKGKYGMAHKAFEKALELNPNYTEASLNLSVVYNDLGKYKEAKEVYAKAKKASDIDPGEIDPFVKGKLANLHYELGEVYKSISLHDEAINEFKKALIIRPTFVDIKTKLADTFKEQGNLEKAIKEYIDAKKIGKFYPSLNINLGIAYYSQGKYDKARTEWEEVLSKDPENKRAPMYLKLLELGAKEPKVRASSKDKLINQSKKAKKTETDKTDEPKLKTTKKTSASKTEKLTNKAKTYEAKKPTKKAATKKVTKKKPVAKKANGYVAKKRKTR